MSELADLGLNLKIVSVGDLTPHPRNYNTHAADQVDELAASLDDFKQYKNIVGWRDPDDGAFYIVAGHGLWEAAIKRGDAEIVVNDRSDLTRSQAMALMVSDNYTPSRDFDFTVLAGIIGDFEAPEGIPGLGEVGVAEILEMAQAEAPDGLPDPGPQADKGAELQEKWQTELGQVWQMGEHTLFIGSAESARIECDFAIFDPPFDWAWQRQENALSWGIWKTALVMGLAQCMPLAARDDFWHWWVWDAGMNRFGGRGHRPVTGCAMMILLGEHRWHEKAGLAALDRYEIEHFEWPTQVVHIQDHLAGREYKYEKPYALADYILSLYSKAGDTVGDLFAGSGAFLIACENLKRQYHGAELLPENAAVILDRWTRTFESEPQRVK